MSDGRKKVAVWIAVALLVPLTLLIIFTPWSALSVYQLEVRSIRVVALVAALCAVLVSTMRIRDKSPDTDTRAHRLRRATIGVNPFLLALFGLLGAVGFLLLAQAMLRHADAAQMSALVTAMAGQQLSLLIGALLVCRTDRRIPALNRVLAHILIGAMAALFSIATPTIIRALAEHLRFASMHDATIVFSLPVMTVVVVCVLATFAQSSR